MGGASNNGVDGVVYALAMNGTNNLFVGGAFTTVAQGSVSANYVASWDGNGWSALGQPTNNGVDGIVNALLMNGTSTLYLGGSFVSYGGGASDAYYVAYWDGGQFQSLGNSASTELNGTVYALALGATDLYVGGAFTGNQLASMQLNAVANWNGQSFSSIGNGFNGTVYSLVYFSPNLYAVGNFTQTGDGVCVPFIASIQVDYPPPPSSTSRLSISFILTLLFIFPFFFS